MNEMKRSILTAMAVLALSSCSDWTQTESLDIEIIYPWQESPELWEQYAQSLRDYKESEHYIFYASFDNAQQKPVSEKSFLRCLPDSLDIVSLTNGESFSQSDAEDMEWLRSIGTKVLFHIDITKDGSESKESDQFDSYIDEIVASVNSNGLDGYSFTAPYRLDDERMTQMVESLAVRLSSERRSGQLIVFEGNPMAVPQSYRDMIDYFVLDTHILENIYDIKMTVNEAVSRCGLDRKKIILSASVLGNVSDESKKEHPAVNELSERAVAFGGLAIYDIQTDYYHYDSNYAMVCRAIQTLNPSK